MSYEITGTVKKVGEVQSFGANVFTKRELVITIGKDGKYPQDIALECVKDKCALLDDLNEGDQIIAHFDIRGREHNGRYFNSLNCWRIDNEAGQQPSRRPESRPAQEKPPIPPKPDNAPELEDDIPF